MVSTNFAFSRLSRGPALHPAAAVAPRRNSCPEEAVARAASPDTRYGTRQVVACGPEGRSRGPGSRGILHVSVTGDTEPKQTRVRRNR
jgi:hypothetical protein